MKKATKTISFAVAGLFCGLVLSLGFAQSAPNGIFNKVSAVQGQFGGTPCISNCFLFRNVSSIISGGWTFDYTSPATAIGSMLPGVSSGGSGKINGDASTADALATTPSQCSSGFATGVQANGNANCGATNSGNVTISSGSLGQFSNTTQTFTISAVTPGQTLSFNLSGDPGVNIAITAYAVGTSLVIKFSNCAGLTATINAVTFYYRIS